MAVDASHGVVVAETDDVAGGDANLQNYTPWVEYETKVMCTVEEAVPIILESLA